MKKKKEVEHEEDREEQDEDKEEHEEDKDEKEQEKKQDGHEEDEEQDEKEHEEDELEQEEHEEEKEHEEHESAAALGVLLLLCFSTYPTALAGCWQSNSLAGLYRSSGSSPAGSREEPERLTCCIQAPPAAQDKPASLPSARRSRCPL